MTNAPLRTTLLLVPRKWQLLLDDDADAPVPIFSGWWLRIFMDWGRSPKVHLSNQIHKKKNVFERAWKLVYGAASRISGPLCEGESQSLGEIKRKVQNWGCSLRFGSSAFCSQMCCTCSIFTSTTHNLISSSCISVFNTVK